jgi:hypothetical protein
MIFVYLAEGLHPSLKAWLPDFFAGVVVVSPCSGPSPNSESLSMSSKAMV